MYLEKNISNSVGQHGFTLLELVLAVGLVSLLSLFLYKSMDNDFFLKRVDATIERAQRIANSAVLTYYNVSNPDKTNEKYTFPNFATSSMTSLNGVTVNMVTPLNGITYDGSIVASNFVLKVESDHLVSVTFTLPDTDWKIENAKLTPVDLYGSGEDDGLEVTMFSRAQEETFVDLTGISRSIKKNIYLQEVR